MKMRLWWEKWPGRLEYEIECLTKAGIAVRLNKELFAQGIAQLDLQHSVKGEMHNFVVRFPDVYPYTRFEVYAPQLALDHHQDPFSKSVCMIGRSTANWHTSDTVADYMLNRLPQVIQAGESTEPAAVEEIEDRQGEPFTDYYRYTPNQIILVDSSWTVDASITKGFLRIGVDKTNHERPKFAVLAVTDCENNILAEAKPEISALYADRMSGKWVRSHQPIIEHDHKLFLERLKQIDKMLITEKTLIASMIIIGVIFPEEVSWRENKDGWVFLAMQRKGKRG